MPIQEAQPPAGGLYRIGRWPEPFALPPWEFVKGIHRFDDPRRGFRVLYTAEHPATCFLEVLGPLRPSVEVLSLLASMPAGDWEEGLPGPPPITADWRADRRIAHLQLDTGQRWLDLRSLATREALRHELAALIHQLGYTDLDAGTVMVTDRRLTQQIARWAYEQDYQGIAYPCRFDATLTNWALFEGARFVPVEVRAISRNDPDLVGVAQAFDLVIID